MRLPGPYSRAGILIYAVPLYIGPVLAGLSRAPVATLPVFAAAFGLLALKGRVPDLSTAQGWSGLAFLLGVQTVLVALCFSLGRLLAWPFRPLPLPLWLPVVPTLAAAAFAFWRYRDSAGMDALLDEAVEKIHAAAPTHPDGTVDGHRGGSDDTAVARRFHDQLAALDDARAAVSAAFAAMDEGNDAVDLAVLQFLQQPRARSAAISDLRLGSALSLGLTSFDDMVRGAAMDLAYTLIADNAAHTSFPPSDNLPGIADLCADTAECLLAIATHLSDRD